MIRYYKWKLNHDPLNVLRKVNFDLKCYTTEIGIKYEFALKEQKSPEWWTTPEQDVVEAEEISEDQFNKELVLYRLTKND